MTVREWRTWLCGFDDERIVMHYSDKWDKFYPLMVEDMLIDEPYDERESNP
jgi:hypothetical protein